MAKIDKHTGAVTWGDQLFEVRTIKDEFIERFPKVNLLPVMQPLGGLSWMQSEGLDGELLGDEPSIVSLSFANQHLVTISIHPSSEDLKANVEQERWWRAMYRWIVDGQKWLQDQFGEPSNITYPRLFEEEELFPQEFIKLIERNWDYKFQWGQVALSYYSPDMTVGIYIHYDMFLQISTWDELIKECETRIQNEKAGNRMYVEQLESARSLIDILRPHFEFQKVKALVFPTGLFFQPLGVDSGTKVRVDIRPSDQSGYYRVSRDDTAQASYIAEGSHSLLVKELRSFLEPKKL